MSEKRNSISMFLVRNFIVAAAGLLAIGAVRAACEEGATVENFAGRRAYKTCETGADIYRGVSSFVSELRND